MMRHGIISPTIICQCGNDIIHTFQSIYQKFTLLMSWSSVAIPFRHERKRAAINRQGAFSIHARHILHRIQYQLIFDLRNNLLTQGSVIRIIYGYKLPALNHNRQIRRIVHHNRHLRIIILRLLTIHQRKFYWEGLDTGRNSMTHITHSFNKLPADRLPLRDCT